MTETEESSNKDFYSKQRNLFCIYEIDDSMKIKGGDLFKERWKNNIHILPS